MNSKRISAVFIAMFMFFSVFPLNMVYAENTEGEVLSDAAQFSEFDSPDGDKGDLNYEEAVAEESFDTLGLDEEKVINNLNLTNGTPQSEVDVATDTFIPAGSGKQEAIEIEEYSVPQESENSGSRVAEEGSYETNASYPYITLSSTSIGINAGNSSKVTVGYGGYSGSVYFQYSLSNSNISGRWGSWSGSKVPLTITGLKSGSTRISVYLKDGYSNKTLASTFINVTVYSTVSLSLSKYEFDTVYNKRSSIGVTVSGATVGMRVAFRYSKGNSVSCQWGSFTNNTVPLYIKGIGAGTSEILVQIINSSGTVLASKVLKVNVTKSAQINLSQTSVSLKVGQSSSVKVSYSNAYGSIYAQYSINNSNVSCFWNGWSLKIGAVKKGATTVTIKLYNSSNDLLATKSISASSNESVSLSCSVSSLSLKVGGSSNISYTFSGTSSSVYYSFSISNSNICSAGWVGSWVNNSHALRVTGKKVGSTNLTVYLKRSSDNAILAAKTITVSVIGAPSISLSLSSTTLKVGNQVSLTATASNVYEDYVMSYSTSGTCFSCKWTSTQIVNNKANLAITGTKEGTGTLTVSLKINGKVVASTTCKVTVQSVSNPNLSFTNSSMSLTKGASATNNVSFSGVSGSVKVSYSLSNSNISATWGSYTGSYFPLKITAKQEGTTTVTIKLIKSSNNAVLATKSFTVKVVADPGKDINSLSYSFPNYITTIPLSTFRLAFGNNSRTTRLFNAYSYSEGVCYGMSATAMMLKNGTYLTPGSFGKSSTLSLSRSSDVSRTHNMSLQVFIELMHITQYSTTARNAQISGLSNLCDAVGKGNIVEILIFDNDQGHALIGYLLDKENNRLYVSDSNYPGGTARYISLTKNSSGKYTGWSYNISGSEIWSSSNGGTIKYQTLSSINSQWSNRGSLSIASGWIPNMLLTNSDDFKIYDVEKNVVATYSDGVFETELDGAEHIVPISYNPDGEQYEYEYNLFYLPPEFYIVENMDDDIEKFKAEMMSEDLGIVVETDANVVSFAVEDKTNLCSMNLTLDENDYYDVTLMSSRENEDDITVNGVGIIDNTTLNLNMTNGVLTHSNTYGASISINDEKKNYYTIEAIAGNGGSISAEGISKPMKYSDLTYKITADEGFVIADVLVDGESVGIVEEYTFSQIEKDSVIEAVFEKLPIGFAIEDISVGKFYYGDKILLKAKFENKPDGSKVVWESSNPDAVSVNYSGDGSECVLECIGSDVAVITAKIVNADGSDFSSENGVIVAQKEISAVTNIIFRIISAIKNILRINRFVA